MKRFIISFIAAFAVVASACASAPDPEPAPARIPRHIMTWAFDQKFAQGENVSAADVQRLLTYALSGLGNPKAQKDCANSGKCSSVFYFDPALVYDSTLCPFSADKDVIAAAKEDWYVHLPGQPPSQATRVRGTYMQSCKGAKIPVPVYELNQNNPEVAGYFAAYLQRNADAWDYYEMDDTSNTLVDQFYGPGGGFCKASSPPNGYCKQTQEIADDDALHAAHANFARGLKHSDGRPMLLFYNGISFSSGGPQVPLLRYPSFRGALCENCVVSAGSLRTNMYGKTLDAMARVNAINGAQFVELVTGSSPAGSPEQIAQRLVTTAVAWLGFSNGHTVVWPDLETNTKNLAVWPEDEIYPARAFASMSNGPADLEVSPSVWRREFAQCYRSGAEIGPCAAVLNGSTSPVRVSPSWFRSRFAHSLSLRGGDSLSGGSLDFTSASSDVTIAPGQAVLLVR